MNRWDTEYCYKDTLLIQKSYLFYLKCYFKKKGFKYFDGDFCYEDNHNEKTIRPFIIGRHIGIDYLYRQNDKIEVIWLHRYVKYPELLDLGCNFPVPYPSWGYGFIETMIETMENFLLNDMIKQTGLFFEIKEDFFNYHQKWLNKARGRNTYNPQEMTIKSFHESYKEIEEENKKMVQIPFEQKYLFFENYKKRMDPFQNMNIKKI